MISTPPVVLSVVIPALNAAATLPAQLTALLAQVCPVPFEVVVADNGSVDGTQEVVRRQAVQDTRVRFVDASEAVRGGAAAKNEAVWASRGKFLAFCDADDLVAPGWLREIYGGLQDNHAVVVSREYWSLNPSLPRDVFPETATDILFHGVPTVAGGAFGIHRQHYVSLGGFDEEFLGAVDIDFGLRLFACMGAAPGVLPGAVVHCRVPTGAIGRFRRYRALARSIPVLLRRHESLLALPLGSQTRRRMKLLLWLCSRPHLLFAPGRRLRWMQSAGTLLGELEGISSLARKRNRAAVRDVVSNAR